MKTNSKKQEEATMFNIQSNTGNNSFKFMPELNTTPATEDQDIKNIVLSMCSKKGVNLILQSRTEDGSAKIKVSDLADTQQDNSNTFLTISKEAVERVLDTCFTLANRGFTKEQGA